MTAQAWPTWWHLVTALLVPLVAWLWAFAGAHRTPKAWRRYAVPLVLGWLTGTVLVPWRGALLAVLLSASLHPGYGQPDPTGGDPGSSIARFWNRWIRKPEQLRNMTRVTTGLLHGLAMLPAATSPGAALAATLIAVLAEVVFGSWIQNEGTVEIPDYDLTTRTSITRRLLWEEWDIGLWSAFAVTCTLDLSFAGILGVLTAIASQYRLRHRPGGTT